MNFTIKAFVHKHCVRIQSLSEFLHTDNTLRSRQLICRCRCTALRRALRRAVGRVRLTEVVDARPEVPDAALGDGRAQRCRSVPRDAPAKDLLSDLGAQRLREVRWRAQ